jgi:tagatose-6-phosphate ketose/aldose isomerase
LLRELDRKKLGASRVVVGASVPAGLASRPEDVLVDVEAAGALSDPDLVVVDVLVGQVLAFFRCLGAGLRPDSPSAGGVINRVVESFAIHARP